MMKVDIDTANFSSESKFAVGDLIYDNNYKKYGIIIVVKEYPCAQSELYSFKEYFYFNFDENRITRIFPEMGKVIASIR